MIKKLFSLFFALTIIVLQSPLVRAERAKDTLFPYYDASANCTTIFNSPDASDAAFKGIRETGLQAPYIMEQFVIEVLKSVAIKSGVPLESAVTEEHVVALIAFAWGEGGDIANDSVFNLFNTGYQDADLLAGAGDIAGRQAYKSFDAGVEATARTMMGGNQDRLAAVLTNKSSTAQQFMEALTYFDKYEGNQFWASASLPPHDSKYYNTRLQLVEQVQRDYKDHAATVIGTPEHEQSLGLKEVSLLQFNIGAQNLASGDDSVSGLAGGCFGPVAGAAGIVQTAIKFSWPDKSPESIKLIPDPDYEEALDKYYPKGAPLDGASCDVFVTTVMKASGNDPNYYSHPTSLQEKYVRDHPELYDIDDKVESTAELLPGDILIINGGGHTFIYIGPQPPNGYDTASASHNERMGNLGFHDITGDSRGYYMRARLK